MFHEGDLKSGIALALQEQKCFACFIKDEGEESRRWEQDYLTDHQLVTALNAKAITLRIEASSQEATFLNDYHPIPLVPALILIHNGQLLLHVKSGESKDHVKAQMLRTMSAIPSIASSLPSAGPSNSSLSTDPGDPLSSPSRRTDETAPSVSPRRTIQIQPSLPEPSPETHIAPADMVTEPRRSLQSRPSAVEGLLAERRRKLDIDKAQKDDAEKEERKAKAEARKAAVALDPTSPRAKQAIYALQQRQRQQEAALERERIVRQIEHDKAERRQREEQRKATALAIAKDNIRLDDQKAAMQPVKDPPLKESATKTSTGHVKGSLCTVQVRLFDGGKICERFALHQTLRRDVRPWVEKHRSSDEPPFTFKQILTPMPNRALSISEEEESLQNLGLVPSATLVIVPIQGYTAAYSGDQGLLSRSASLGFNVVATGAGFVTGAVGSLLGYGPTPNAADLTTSASSEVVSNPNTTGVHVRTLRPHQDTHDEHQLYNGNQLNFEPRRKERDKIE